MRRTVYAMYTCLRNWTVGGEIFATESDRTESLRALVETFRDDIPDDADDNWLQDACEEEGHDVFMFENEIEVAITDERIVDAVER